MALRCSVRLQRATLAAGAVPAAVRRGSAPDNKTAVLALVNRETGQVDPRVIPDVTAPTLRKAIAERVNMAAADLQTDSRAAYKSIAPEFRSHRSVNHNDWEYVAKDGATTNPAELFFAQ